MKRAHDETDPYRRTAPLPPTGSSLTPLAPAPPYMSSAGQAMGQGQGGANDQMGYSSMVARTNAASVPNNAAAQAATSAAQAQSYRQLNVKDALQYLDQVKQQFETQPDVYNQFLDIMKDFKSQSIDTPGVIQRVSSLFRGHRALIQGFNTFLPPGFKIELPTDDMNLITVHIEGSPQGSYQINPNAPMPMSLPFRPPVAPPPAHYGGSSAPAPVSAPQHQASYPSNARKQPIEFNQAISYVNKIKTRFSAQPDIYKSFLEILHTYQDEQKTIKEVYDQVAQLFRNHHDLLGEFSQFLPDTTGNASLLPLQGMGVMGSGRAPPPSAPASAEHFMQPVRRNKQPVSKVKGRAGQALAPAVTGAAAGQHTVSGTGKMRPTMGVPAQYGSQSASSAGYYKGAASSRPDVGSSAGLSGSLVNAAVAAGTPLNQLEEIEFFDRVKRALTNRQQYSEFLRCLNLFSQDILSKQDLVDLVGNFLGRHPDLLDWFKRFVGYKEPQPGTLSEPRMTHAVPAVDYSKLKRLGSSYRALPRNAQHPKCSGRTDLCEEVLNNVWVSVPIWSEDAPFLASRKNIYEEAIYKAEDERYELDHVLEANTATVRVFEGLMRKMQTMSAEEQNRMRLGNNLGGTSDTIYQGAIRRAYGAHAPEVIAGLKRNPAVSVAVVLARLRQKDDEWRRGQREWNKLWRDTYTKNYFKGLDYQGINFKSNDRKTLMTRSLVQEAEALLQDQRKRAAGSPAARPLPQFDFNVSSTDLHADVFRILANHLEKVGGISSADKDKIGTFMHVFLARFLHLDAATLPAPRVSAHGAANGNGVESDSMDVDVTGPGPAHIEPTPIRATLEAAFDAARARNGAETVFGSNTIYAFFRLYFFLYSRLAKAKELGEQLKDDQYGARRLNTAARNLGLQLKLQEQPALGWYGYVLDLIDRFVDGKIDPQKFEDTVRDILGIASYPLATVDKLTHALLKQMHSIVTDTVSRRLLGIYFSSHGGSVPSLFVVSNEELRQSRDAEQDGAAVEGADGAAAAATAGGSSRKKEKEERRREEQQRRKERHEDLKETAREDDGESSPALPAYGASALRMPNLRRPVLYASGASLQDDDAHEIAAVREEVESIVGGENVFKVDLSGDRSLLIRLLPRPLSARWNQSEGTEASWSQYVDQYIRMEATSQEQLSTTRVFLPRTCRKHDPSHDQRLVVVNQLECKICINTYKMFFVAGTEDTLYRPSQTPIDVEAFKQQGVAHAAKWHAFLEGPNGYKRGEPANAASSNTVAVPPVATPAAPSDAMMS